MVRYLSSTRQKGDPGACGVLRVVSRSTLFAFREISSGSINTMAPLDIGRCRCHQIEKFAYCEISPTYVRARNTLIRPSRVHIGRTIVYVLDSRDRLIYIDSALWMITNSPGRFRRPNSFLSETLPGQHANRDLPKSPTLCHYASRVSRFRTPTTNVPVSLYRASVTTAA